MQQHLMFTFSDEFCGEPSIYSLQPLSRQQGGFFLSQEEIGKEWGYKFWTGHQVIHEFFAEILISFSCQTCHQPTEPHYQYLG